MQTIAERAGAGNTVWKLEGARAGWAQNDTGTAPTDADL
jgi:hypothetical protein